MSAVRASRCVRLPVQRGRGVWCWPTPPSMGPLYVPGLETALRQELAQVQAGFLRWKGAAMEELERRWATATPPGRPYSAEEQRLLAVHQTRMMTLQRQNRLDLERDLRRLHQRLKTEGERQARATALELSRILERERLSLEEEARHERQRQLSVERSRLETDLLKARANLTADAEQTRERAVAAERERHAQMLEAELTRLRERLHSQSGLLALRDELSLRHARELDDLNAQLSQERDADLSAEHQQGQAALAQERQALEEELGGLAAAQQEECRRQHQQVLNAELLELTAAGRAELEELRQQHEATLFVRLQAERERLIPELERQASEARAAWNEERLRIKAEHRQSRQAAAEAALTALQAELQAAHAERLAQERTRLEAELTVTLHSLQGAADHAMNQQFASLRAEAAEKLNRALEEQRRAAQALQEQRRAEQEDAGQRERNEAWSQLEAELLDRHRQALSEQALQLSDEAAAAEVVARQNRSVRTADQLAERATNLEARLALERGAGLVASRAASEATPGEAVNAPVIAGVRVSPDLLPDVPAVMFGAVLAALRLVATHGEVAQNDLGRLVPPDQSVRRFRRDLDGAVEALVQGGEHVFLRVTRHDDTYYVLNPRRQEPS